MLEMVLNETSWVAANKYQSPEIIIKLMGHKVLRSLIGDKVSTVVLIIMADETTDVSNREQLVVTLRWVTETYEIREYFCGLLQLDETTLVCIHITISQYLMSLGIPFKSCRGQAYDSASSFQGHINGVASRSLSENPAALSTQCLAHCVNLCLQELGRSVKSIKEALNFCTKLIQLIKCSPKRQVVFEKIQAQHDSPSQSRICSFCPTRWTVRTSAIKSILDNYEALQLAMEASSHGSDDCLIRCSGMIALMEKFNTYFGLELSFLVFSITEQLSVTLQCIDTNAYDCFVSVNVTINGLRTDEKFKSFYDLVKKNSDGKCDPPILPRQRRIPRRINDGVP